MNLRIFRKVKDAIILDKAVGYRMEKDFFSSYISNMGSISKIYKEVKKQLDIQKQPVNQVQQRGGTYPKQKFSIEKTLCFWETKKCSTYLAIWEMQTKTLLDFTLHLSERLRTTIQVTA